MHTALPDPPAQSHRRALVNMAQQNECRGPQRTARVTVRGIPPHGRGREQAKGSVPVGQRRRGTAEAWDMGWADRYNDD